MWKAIGNQDLIEIGTLFKSYTYSSDYHNDPTRVRKKYLGNAKLRKEIVLDVLDTEKTIKICVGYELNGKKIDSMLASDQDLKKQGQFKTETQSLKPKILEEKNLKEENWKVNFEEVF